SSRRRHTRLQGDWSSDVCSSDLALFLGFGYIGVPVAFSLTAGVLVATAMTPISLPSMIGQLFNGVDSEALLAVPFFLLVGELMRSEERRVGKECRCRVAPEDCIV